MALKFLKENLPWIAPSAAIVFAASGYFDGSFRSSQAPAEQSQPAQFAPTQAAQVQPTPSTVVAPAPVGAAQATSLTQNAAQPQQVVARADTSFSTGVVAPQTQPSFTDTQPVAQAGLLTQQLGQQVQQPQQPAQQVASFEQDPAAFFKGAQATLNAANSCKEDLRALASQARVYFPSGGLTAEEAGLEQARLIGTVAQNCNGVGILVTGHSDPSGDPVANQRLSQKRANFVVQRVSAAGIDTSAFVAQGYGDREPSTVTGPKARAYYDRRVEFSVVDLKTNASFKTTAPVAFAASCVTELEKAVLQTKLFYSPRSIAASASDMGAVLDLAQKAQACPQARLRIIGHHTDESWANEDVNTGILRAKALMSSLVGQGIASEQVIIAAPSRSVGVAGRPELSNSRVDFDVIQEPS